MVTLLGAFLKTLEPLVLVYVMQVELMAARTSPIRGSSNWKGISFRGRACSSLNISPKRGDFKVTQRAPQITKARRDAAAELMSGASAHGALG